MRYSIDLFLLHISSRPSANISILRKFFIDHELSAKQIERLSNRSWDKVSIIGALRKGKIKRPRQSSRLKFGEKQTGGKRVPHLREQKVIKLIISLHESGKSLRGIADYLNNKGTPTKRGGKWNKTTVGDILKRESGGRNENNN